MTSSCRSRWDCRDAVSSASDSRLPAWDMPEPSWPDPDRLLLPAPLGGFSGLYLNVLQAMTVSELSHHPQGGQCMKSVGIVASIAKCHMFST